MLLSADVTVDKQDGFLGVLATAAEDFIAVFNKGGSVLLSLMGGILPTLIVLLTAVNALVRLIGPEKIENLERQLHVLDYSGIQFVTSSFHSLQYSY